MRVLYFLHRNVDSIPFLIVILLPWVVDDDGVRRSKRGAHGNSDNGALPTDVPKHHVIEAHPSVIT